MTQIECIDVSEWQGSIDWKKLKASGISCALLRAGYGRNATQKDSQFETYYRNAKAQNFRLGAYWYSYATDEDDAVREAKACLEVLKGKSFEIPVFFDMEESSMTKLSRERLTKMAKLFCDTLINNGYRAGVYSNPNWFQNHLDYAELKKSYPIWLAQYYKEPQYECDIWQYTSAGKAEGVTGNVDRNIIFSESIFNTPTKENTQSNETALTKALLRQAYAQGICKTFLKPVDNAKTESIGTCVLECKKTLGYKNPDSTVDEKFISELEHEVNVRRIDKEKKLRDELSKAESVLFGDFNLDGKLDIKDVTAIQKKLAGLEAE